MNQRLIQFLSAENLSQSQFADAIGVARASVSHIIAGRNKPGFDFIESMAKHYPSLNIEWLITGKGRMYKSSIPGQTEMPAQQKPQQIQTPSPDASNGELHTGIEPFGDDLFAADSSPLFEPKAKLEVNKAPSREAADAVTPLSSLKKSNLTQRSITKVMLFYDDNTFQELK